MRKYQLTQAAEDDLTDIYAYTFDQFGERQADAYFELLEQSLSRLAENPRLGVDVGRLRAGYRRFIHSQHSIYYTASESGILVVRVLGPGMFPERHLSGLP